MKGKISTNLIKNYLVLTSIFADILFNSVMCIPLLCIYIYQPSMHVHCTVYRWGVCAPPSIYIYQPIMHVLYRWGLCTPPLSISISLLSMYCTDGVCVLPLYLSISISVYLVSMARVPEQQESSINNYMSAGL